jgi:hypothetical protein
MRWWIMVKMKKAVGNLNKLSTADEKISSLRLLLVIHQRWSILKEYL